MEIFRIQSEALRAERLNVTDSRSGGMSISPLSQKKAGQAFRRLRRRLIEKASFSMAVSAQSNDSKFGGEA
jgi:hypothetical protein